MTEDKKVRWFNQDVSLDVVVSFTLWGTAALVLFATVVASFGLVSWWLVFFAAVVPPLWLVALVGSLLYIQIQRARQHHTQITVKLKVLSWTTERTWDYR